MRLADENMAGPNNSQRLNTVSISGLYDNETNVKKLIHKQLTKQNKQYID